MEARPVDRGDGRLLRCLFARRDPGGRIAQLVEHRPYKARVTGSSPVPPTKEIRCLHCIVSAFFLIFGPIVQWIVQSDTGAQTPCKQTPLMERAGENPLTIPLFTSPATSPGGPSFPPPSGERYGREEPPRPAGRSHPMRQERSRAGGGEVIISSEDSTRFCRKVSEGALTNRSPISGKQILEAVEEAVGLLELSR